MHCGATCLAALSLLPGTTPPKQSLEGPVLVIAPHPDDETLGCGGVIATRIAQGRRVVVVVVTDGRALLRRFGVTDPSELEVAAMRKAETLRAAEILGVVRRDIRFLDFENEALAARREVAERMIADILTESSPAEVYVTSPFEGHPEHVLVNEMTRSACAATGRCPAVFEYIVTLARGQTLEALPRRVLRIDVSKARDRERLALAQFRSHLDLVYKGQREPLTSSYDRYLTNEELFLVAP